MGFTKLDERILQSSIMAEDPWTFKVWIALLAACKENGIAYVSATYVETICHMKETTVQRALTKLEMPDPNSRSLVDEGRRIRRIDGGYEVINYQFYRERTLRDVEAERKRIYRMGKKDSPGLSRTVQGPSASASPSASDIKEGGDGGGRFEEFWGAYPRKRDKEDARTAWLAIKKADRQLVIDAAKRYFDMVLRTKIDLTKIKHAATFLHKERWRDFDEGGAGTFEGARQIEAIEKKGTQANFYGMSEETLAELKAEYKIQLEAYMKKNGIDKPGLILPGEAETFHEFMMRKKRGTKE